MQVVQFQRKPTRTHFSVEGYFDRVRETMRSDASFASVTVWTAPCFSRGLFNRIRNIIAAAREQGDVNHITGDIHYVCLLMRRRRTVLTVLDCQVLERLTGWRRGLVKLLWFTIPARRVARITTISEETKRRLLEEVRFPHDRVHVVPVSVSADFRPCPRPFNAECPRILQVGTKPNKNVDRLVEALRGVSCVLDIVGPIEPSLRELLTASGVAFENSEGLSDADIVRKYEQADIVSFVSTHEGFGMPIVEAQCVERPVVTSQCSSMPEVAGDGACFVDPFDVESIAAGFRRVIEDDQFRDDIIRRGRANRQRFDEAEIAANYNAIYETVWKREEGRRT